MRNQDNPGTLKMPSASKSSQQSKTVATTAATASSPARSKKTRISNLLNDDSDCNDEVQLCKVKSGGGGGESSPVSERFYTPEPNPPRMHSDQLAAARAYYQQHSPTRMTSSPKLNSDSWQDASTEPMTPIQRGVLYRQSSNNGDATTRTNTEARNSKSNYNSSGMVVYSPERRSTATHNQRLRMISPRALSTSNTGNTVTTPMIATPNTSNPINTPSNTITSEIPPTSILSQKIIQREVQQRLSEAAAAAATVTDIENKGKTTVENPLKRKATDDMVDLSTNENQARTLEKDAKPHSDKPKRIEIDKSEQPKDNSQNNNKRLTEEEEAEKEAEEIKHLMSSVKSLPNYYQLIGKIGEGTFSTVYKALDVRRDLYINDDWEPQLLQSFQSNHVTSPKIENADVTHIPEEDQQQQQKSPSSPSKVLTHYVALKRVYHTSSPRRIANEVAILRKLKGSKNISPLITAFRQQDFVFLVMPYIPHDDFKKSYFEMDLTDIKYYLRSLFTALAELHKNKILHRDVKPNNFLYNIRRRTGYLIDFGLAETEKDTETLHNHVQKLAEKTMATAHALLANNANYRAATAAAAASNTSTPTPGGPSSSVFSALSNKEKRASAAAAAVAASAHVATTHSAKAGYVKNDSRNQIQANRAGTRGFRAPEVLMRVTKQTCAIDVWSVGCICLCFFTGRYPFFIANDEADSLVEIGQMFGMNEVKRCAEHYGRFFTSNVNVPKSPTPLETLSYYLNDQKVVSWDKQDYEDGLDLVTKCLKLIDTERITATEALKHRFLQIDK